MTKNLTKVIIFVCILLVLVLLGAFYLNSKTDKESVEIITEKKAYSVNEELKVEIKNNTSDKICFSSCYPYMMQVKNNDWSDYSYSDCDKDNVVENCIDSNSLKAFGISLSEMFLESAPYRLAVSACIGCAVGENFRVDEIIYSNEFEVKK
jgi:regulatory protein YycI of two-component signal transduction system YycFG